MTIRSTILWIAALIILGMVNVGVFQKEQLRTNGELLYMELAPVDPRSLIQGDYMALDYALLRELAEDELPNRGQILIDFDEQRVATGGALYEANQQQTPNQLLINYRSDGWQMRIGAENYFFQEGKAELFEEAEYAELRIGPDGGLILVGLTDGQLNRLGTGETP